MSKVFVNMDYNSVSSKYWVEYYDSSTDSYTVLEYDSKAEQTNTYTSLLDGTFS